MSGRDHFEAGGDRPGAEHVVLPDDYVFQTLLFPLLRNVFGDFVIMNGACGMWDGGEIAMLLANFISGDEFF